MANTSTVRRSFSLNDQDTFARLSGDYNPLHLDPVYTRRSFFGAAVVHGIHSLLLALDCWLAEQQSEVTVVAIRATFDNPLRVGDNVGPLGDGRRRTRNDHRNNPRPNEPDEYSDSIVRPTS